MLMVRWDGSTSLHTAVKGECSEGEIYRYLLILEKLRLFISTGVVVMLILYERTVLTMMLFRSNAIAE